MKIIERLFQYFDYKGIKPTNFEKKIGLSNGYLGTQLRRKGNLGEEILLKIIDNSLDINPIWLLTGKGNMLKEEVTDQVGSDSNENEKLKRKIDQLEKSLAEREREIDRLMKIIEMITGYAERKQPEENKDNPPAHRQTG